LRITCGSEAGKKDDNLSKKGLILRIHERAQGAPQPFSTGVAEK
jgi:hypothetical protein